MDERFLDPGGQQAGLPDLAVPRARGLASVLAGGALAFARLVGCRRGPAAAPEGEAVIFEAEVERPQLPVYPIRQVERVAAVFAKHPGLPPEVLALRADFPLVPHLNLRATEFPRSLCLDDRPWAEVSRRWTAAAFVERVRWWLAQTARGTLHRDDQPLEPLVADTAVPLLLPAALIASPLQTQEFLAVNSVPGPHGSFALRAERVPAGGDGGSGPEYLAIALRCQPRPHGVIRHHPDTLDQLHALTFAAGLDLKRELQNRLREWRYRQRVRNSRLIILLSLPKQRRTGGPVEDTDHFAVACFDTVMEVALKLGEWRLPARAKRSRRRGRRAVKPPKAGEPINVFLLRPVFGLTPARAAQLCGGPPGAAGRRVAVGSGALGSQVLMNMARAGHVGWDVIDDDRLLPHNLQRHALGGTVVGYAKATALACLMNSVYDGPPAARDIPVNLLHPGGEAGSVDRALVGARAVLDLSASVAVARHLAWRGDVKGRRVSLFLNPRGADLVLLAEDAGRAVALDSLEMQYYRAVLREPRLADHLRPPDGRVRYSASCRDVSARVPTHLVALHAAIGAGAVAAALDRPEASITLWQADPGTLAVTPVVVKAAAARRGRIGEWTLVVDDELLARLTALRDSGLPNETGGVLLGAYDMDRRAVYVVDTIPSPPDSAEWPTLYIRGCEGLPQQVADAGLRTSGQVEYVGEWHSHPDGCPARPSGDDLKVFAWLTEHMAGDGLPALMAIVGEGAGSTWYVGEMRPGAGWGMSHDR